MSTSDLLPRICAAGCGRSVYQQGHLRCVYCRAADPPEEIIVWRKNTRGVWIADEIYSPPNAAQTEAWLDGEARYLESEVPD